MQTLNPSIQVVDIVKEAGGDALKLCYQCGLCTGTCPWNLVRSFIVRRMLHESQLGLVDFEGEDLWLCATCGACVERCPRGVEIIDIMKALRKVVAEMGVATVPDSLRITSKNISAVGNPQGEPQEKRAEWAQQAGAKAFSEGTEILYFPCCIPAYDPKVKRVAHATANVLNKAGVDFGILQSGDRCCGESVRKAGSEGVFQSLAQANMQLFTEAGVKKMVVSSPHCYHTFKNEYPGLADKVEILHSTQYLAELLRDGKLKPAKQLNKKVAYHDPCYLGRHNSIYDEPREVLQSIPGVELIELPDMRENSICCGGGGGRIWMETAKGERFSDLRLEHALGLGADVLAVACPYCVLNFDDSVLNMEKEGAIEIKDVSELVFEAVQ